MRTVRMIDVAVVGLLAALMVQICVFILANSATFDEPAYIGAGASYVKTGRLEIEHLFHPPLQKYLIGISVNMLHPNFPADPAFVDRYTSLFGCFKLGRTFLFNNSVPVRTLLASARLPTMLLSLVLAVFIFAWAQRWFGEAAGVLALGVYALEPNVIANSGLATMDVPLACHMFAASFLLVTYVEQGDLWRLIASGLFAGFAVATKIPGLFFFALAPLFYWMEPNRPKNVKSLPVVGIILTVLTLAVLAVVYQFRYLPLFIELVRGMFEVVFKRNAVQDYPNFLHGQVKTGGWWYFYPVTFAVKTSLPMLALLAAALLKVPREKKFRLLAPVLLFVVILTVAEKQHGWRYLMPVFPFLCVLTGGLAVSLPRRAVLFFIAPLFGWMVVEAAWISPNNLTYFNRLVGGPANGYKWLVDCNLDWGQDFDRIRDFLKKQPPSELIVATFGTGDRNLYFGPHQDLLADSNNLPAYFTHINSERPERELLIVSATLLQGFGLSDPTVFAWLRQKMPLAQVGYSTFVYDVTNDAASQFNIGTIYERNGLTEYAQRQYRRAVALNAAQTKTETK